jgi:hypothetical protein
MWDNPAVDDAIARYRASSEVNDIDGMMATLADNAELISPLSGRMVFRGKDDLRTLVTVIYGSLKGLRWREELGEGSLRLVTGEARVGPVKLGDAMVCEMAEDGRILRIRPYIRPWIGLTVLALKIAPKMARHPAVLLRALRG